jgi:hypothetical protein
VAARGATASPTASPNLTWSSYSYYSGCAFQLLNINVTNNGDADAGPSVVTTRVDHRFIGFAGYDQVLSPGESIDVGPFPPVTVRRGAHLVTFLLDAKHEVAESDESDNFVAFAFICE